jgi:1-acyl-sn-glycerol-3-phosphate acyltransferase
MSGYLPSKADDALADLVVKRMDNMGDYLSSGGILFIFPEGTRSRDGSLGAFRTGAFRIANRFQVPINVVAIRNTQKIYKPDRFRFDTGVKYPIQLDYRGTITPVKAVRPSPAIDDQIQQARELLEPKEET